MNEYTTEAMSDDECFYCPRTDDLKPCIVCGFYHCPDHSIRMITRTKAEMTMFNQEDLDADGAVICVGCSAM